MARSVFQRLGFRFDTEGDDVPGGFFVADVSFSFGGPHPGFDLDLCALLD